MTRVLSLYHGSEHVVEHPDLAHGKPHNDYGRGFYCTEDHAMACEWACKQGTDGFANEYELDASNLRILDLNGGGYTTLHWIALLLANRTFSLSSELAQDARAYLLDRFLVDMEGCDLVRGYRADDSYFAYAEAFVENGLSLRQLNTALHLGKLGEQVALVSDKAFISLSFVGATPAPAAVYYPRFKQRDQTARSEYRTRVRGGASYRDDLFILDILRQEMTPDDPRLQ